MVVVGAGPAGSVAALLLARWGARVALVHEGASGPSGAARPLLGEVLPPPARAAFARLDLGEVLEHPGHVAVPGSVAAWGSDVPTVVDHLLSPFGDAIQVDRGGLDDSLRQAAADAGATLVHGPRRAWGQFAEPAGPRVVIDASGRAATVARGAGGRSERADRLVAIVGVLEPPRGNGGRAHADADRRVLVAAQPDGWWSSMVLPDGRRIAAFHTDGDLRPRMPAGGTDAGAWCRALARTPLIGPRVAAEGRLGPGRVQVVAADSRRLVEAGPVDRGGGRAERRPLVVGAGDAEMAFDPLSSLGIVAALSSAEEAAGAALAWLGGSATGGQRALAARATAREARWARYRQRLAMAYGQESRWTEAPFWARRRPR